MESLEENHNKLDKLNTVALGIGVDSVPSNKAWANELKIEKTRLLSDFWPHGKVSMLYGVFREKGGFSERANIIVDENQTVVFAKMYPLRELPDIDEILKFLKAHA
jgi:peroxiredoxin